MWLYFWFWLLLGGRPAKFDQAKALARKILAAVDLEE